MSHVGTLLSGGESLVYIYFFLLLKKSSILCFFFSSAPFQPPLVFGSSPSLPSGVLSCHLLERVHGFHYLVGREGLLHLAVLVHLVDALRHRDGHLLGRHAIVLPLGLREKGGGAEELV